jgi:hypothetical protein
MKIRVLHCGHYLTYFCIVLTGRMVLTRLCFPVSLEGAPIALFCYDLGYGVVGEILSHENSLGPEVVDYSLSGHFYYSVGDCAKQFRLCYGGASASDF